MTDTTVSDAVVFPQDEGTGVPDGSEDYDSAAYFAALARAGDASARLGLGLSGSDSDSNGSWDSATVASGLAYVEASGDSVQSGSQASYDTTLPEDDLHMIALPTSVSISVAEGVSKYSIWLAHDPTSQDSVYLRHGDDSNVSAPSDPSVYLGYLDTSSNAAYPSIEGARYQHLAAGPGSSPGDNRDTDPGLAPLMLNADGNSVLAKYQKTGGANVGLVEYYTGKDSKIGDTHFSAAGGSVVWTLRSGGSAAAQIHTGRSDWESFPSLKQDLILDGNDIVFDKIAGHGYGLRYQKNGQSKVLNKDLKGTTAGNEYSYEFQIEDDFFEVVAQGNGGGSFQDFYTRAPARRLKAQYDAGGSVDDPTDPPANESVVWQSDGTNHGDGDIMMKVTDSAGTTKTVTLVDFSAN